MAFNIFEGSRRVAKLVALLGVLTYGIYVWNYSPYVPIYYVLNWPGDAPILAKDARDNVCQDSSMEYRSGVTTKSGKEIALTMCFVKQIASDGRALVFYEKVPLEGAKEFTIEQKRALAAAKTRLNQKNQSSIESNTQYDFSTFSTPELKALQLDAKYKYLGNEPHNDKVTEYKKRTLETFVIPVEDQDWIETQWKTERWKDIREATLGLIGGLAFFWSFTWIVGWIVRGFMGIPRGKDHRENSANTPTSS